MANAWHLQQKSRRAFDSVSATIRFLAALAAEYALALQAATKAASPRRCLCEVRAMCLLPRIAFPGMAVIAVAPLLLAFGSADAQLIDRTKAPNAAGEGIAKTLEQQVGADRGDWNTPQSSAFIIARDPFRAIKRGRQLFSASSRWSRARGH